MAGEMACSDPGRGGQWTARLEGRYTSESYDLEMVMEMPNPWDPAPMTITSRVQGRRTGACEAPAARKEGKQR